MTYLLDTSVAILLRDANPLASARFGGMPTLPAMSVVSRVELEGGIHTRVEFAAQRRERLDKLLQRLAVIDFNSDMAYAYGQIVAQLGFSRRKIIDRMIAATAIVDGLTLITANGGDFAEIEGLTLEAWDL